MENRQVGTLNKTVINMFNLNLNIDSPIFIGVKNIEHIKTKHPKDFEMYGDKIEQIISSPDFIAKHPKKDSIEYIKKFKVTNTDYVLVAVRTSGSGTLFARTLFVMSQDKVAKYEKCNALKPYK